MTDATGAKPRQDALWLALGVVTLVASVSLCLSRRPLGDLTGLADEWWLLGLNVAVSGTVGLGHEPFVGRAPGYPAFMGAVLRLFTSVPDAQSVTLAYVKQATYAVVLTQCLLHGACTVALFAWLRRRVRAAVALAAGLAFGLNPYSLILCGLLHYDVLHLVFLVLSGWATTAVLDRARPRAVALFGTGALWGLTALIRPVTLPFPLFVALIVLLRDRTWRGIRRAALAATFLAAGMAVTIAPWTARNYRLTHAIIPVNAQGWAAVWGSTVKPLPLDPNRYLWYLVADEHQWLPVIQRVTGKPEYRLYECMRHAAEIDAAFREVALRNIRRQPQVYVRNVIRSFVTLNFQINSVFVSVFERLQAPAPHSFQHGWSTREGAPERQPTALSRVFDVFVAMSTLLAVWGIAWSVRRKDAFALVPAAVYACICLAHVFTHMDLMYYYVKMPFLILFAAIGIETACAPERTLGIGRLRVSLGLALAALIATSAISTTVALFWVTAR